LYYCAGAENENGRVSRMLTSRMTDPPRNLSMPLNRNNHSSMQGGRVTASASETRLLNEHPASTMILDAGETAPPGRRSFIHLKESDAEYSPPGILRHHSSSGLHSSMLGNPVCHPEQEELAALSPTLTMAAAEPHLSLDSDKPCCEAAVDGRSSLTSVNETLCKSNR